MSVEADSREGRAPGRGRWRPGPRAIVEAAVVVAAAVGYGVVREHHEFPRPLVRDLRGGSPAEQAAALRGLSVAGAAGADAVPALLDALRDDPSPAVRRGAAHVLAAIATAPAGGEPFSLDLLLANSEDPALDRAADGRPPAPPHPSIVAASAGLARSLAEDPDPTVRAEALTRLGELLDAALGLRPSEPEPGGLGFPDPSRVLAPEPAFGVEPWMRAAAGAIAGRVGGADLDGSRLATTWIYAAPAAQVLIDDDRRHEALLAGAGAALRGPSDYMDVVHINAAALASRGSADRRRAFLRLLDGPLARPAPEPEPLDPSAISISPFYTNSRTSRPLHPDEHAVPFLMAGPDADELAGHPAALAALVRLLGRDGRLARTFTSGFSRSPEPPLETLVGVRLRDEQERAGLLNMELAPLLLRAIRDDPRILDLLGDRLGPGHWGPLLSNWGPYDWANAWEQLDLMPLLLDPGLRTALPPDRAAGAADVLLAACDDLPGDAPERHLRALALAAYFLRGAGPASEAAGRFARRAEPLLDDASPEVREPARRLLDGVGPALPPDPVPGA